MDEQAERFATLLAATQTLNTASLAWLLTQRSHTTDPQPDPQLALDEFDRFANLILDNMPIGLEDQTKESEMKAQMRQVFRDQLRLLGLAITMAAEYRKALELVPASSRDDPSTED